MTSGAQPQHLLDKAGVVGGLLQLLQRACSFCCVPCLQVLLDDEGGGQLEGLRATVQVISAVTWARS